MRQILVNLLNNAIKFTEAGVVRLRIELLTSKGEAERLQFSVIDTGVGIAEDELARLFQPFMQGHASIGQSYGGTGLGLAISKRLAVVLGGDITVSSILGQGSTFTLTIDPGSLRGITLQTHPGETMDQRRQRHEAARLEKTAITLGGRILLVEDGPDNQRLISLLLKSAGAEVALAANGLEAIESLSSGLSAQKPFDLVLMDMQMPVMDGYEATRKLRSLGYRGPIVALTAHAMREDKQRCLDAGCDGYISKPIKREQFLATLSEFMRREKQEAAKIPARNKRVGTCRSGRRVGRTQSRVELRGQACRRI